MCVIWGLSGICCEKKNVRRSPLDTQIHILSVNTAGYDKHIHPFQLSHVNNFYSLVDSS